MSFINTKRLRDYPRIFFIATWLILAISLLFRQGWLSAFDQIIGSDFVTLYAAGLVHRTDLPNLYNFTVQNDTQQSLIEPTKLPGLNPYISPPYVAAVYSLFTYIPLPFALVVWSILSFFFTLIAVSQLIKYFPELSATNLNKGQLLIVTMSFFPWIEGFQAGQNHTLTLLLVTLIIIFSLSQKWFLVGAISGVIIYKPQLIIGLIIIWIIWRKYKAIAGFLLVSILCIGSYVLFFGLSPILNYLHLSSELLLLPYVPGFPGYLLLTIYGLLATLFPIEAFSTIRIISSVLSIAAGLGLCWIAYKLRNAPFLQRSPALVLAIVLPLIATPYALLHDIVILIPGFILWFRYQPSKGLLYTSIGIYLGGLFLTLLASVTHIAFVSLLSISVVTLILIFEFPRRTVNYESEIS
jgi:hypothetical protein